MGHLHKGYLQAFDNVYTSVFHSFWGLLRHIKYMGHQEVDEKSLETLNCRADGGSKGQLGKMKKCYMELHGVKWERSILRAIKRGKADWIGQILHKNCLLKQVIEGKIEGTRR
jgi:hypothetical protein